MVFVPRLSCIWCVIIVIFIQKLPGWIFDNFFPSGQSCRGVGLRYQGCLAEITVLFTHKLPGGCFNNFHPRSKLPWHLYISYRVPIHKLPCHLHRSYRGMFQPKKSLMWSCHDIYNETTWARCITHWYMKDYKTTWEIQKNTRRKMFFWLIWKWKKG